MAETDQLWIFLHLFWQTTYNIGAVCLLCVDSR